VESLYSAVALGGGKGKKVVLTTSFPPPDIILGKKNGGSQPPITRQKPKKGKNSIAGAIRGRRPARRNQVPRQEKRGKKPSLGLLGRWNSPGEKREQSIISTRSPFKKKGGKGGASALPVLGKKKKKKKGAARLSSRRGKKKGEKRVPATLSRCKRPKKRGLRLSQPERGGGGGGGIPYHFSKTRQKKESAMVRPTGRKKGGERFAQSRPDPAKKKRTALDASTCPQPEKRERTRSNAARA